MEMQFDDLEMRSDDVEIKFVGVEMTSRGEEIEFEGMEIASCDVEIEFGGVEIASRGLDAETENRYKTGPRDGGGARLSVRKKVRNVENTNADDLSIIGARWKSESQFKSTALRPSQSQLPLCW